MAAANVIELAPAEAGNRPRSFVDSDADDVRRAVVEARAVCHVVALAVQAQADGSVCFDDAAVTRWGPSIDAACDRLRVVREILSETAGAPTHDWWGPLNMLEALGAAMWRCDEPGRSMGETLDECELGSFMGVVIGALDALLTECEADRASEG